MSTEDNEHFKALKEKYPYEPSLFDTKGELNPHWIKWYMAHSPGDGSELMSIAMIRMMQHQVLTNTWIPELWRDFYEQNLAILRKNPQSWSLLMKLNPRKPTFLERFKGFLRRKS